MEARVVEYLRVCDVAKRYGVSVGTIWGWRRNGAFPSSIKLSGRVTVWRLADLEKWEAEKQGSARDDFEVAAREGKIRGEIQPDLRNVAYPHEAI